MIDKNRILVELEEKFPNAKCELNYTTIFELLVAVMLSAQTTDVAVNKVTPALFEKYPTIESLANAKQEDVEKLIQRIGLYKNKAKNIIETAKIVFEQHKGNVPNSIEELIKLPGVGRKTASVVLVEGYKIPAFPVDTHVERVAKRLKIAKGTDDVNKVEKKICKLYDRSLWGKLHHQFIFFGRYHCKSRNPNCDECGLSDMCVYYKSKIESKTKLSKSAK